MLPIETPCVSLFIGNPGSGKSFMIKNLIYQSCYSKKFDYIVVFCNTGFDNAYDFLNEKYVHENYNSDVLEKILKIQIENQNLKCLLIFDDVIGSINFNTPIWKKIITQYRHYNMSIFLAVQYIKDINPRIRTCASYVFVFYTEVRKVLKELYDLYGQSFSNENAFKDFIISKTKDYNTILINTKLSDNKRFLQYKAPKLKNFVIEQT
jgi:hypothetical protein